MAKHRQRMQAFQALYSLSFIPDPDENALAHAFRNSGLDKGQTDKDKKSELSGFAWELTRGVWQNKARLNAAIEKYSHNWSLSRMGKIEALLLQLALYEMFFIKTHPKIVMSESMELADEYGAGGAKSFINGVLDAAARDMNHKAE